MNQNEAVEIIREVEYFSRVLLGVEDKIFSWVEKKEKLFKLFATQLKKHKRIVQKFPDDRIKACANQFVTGKVLGNPVLLRKFLINNTEFINKEEKEFLHHFLDHPWFYTLFTVKESLPNNLLMAVDCSTKQEFLIYSSGITMYYKEGRPLFLCLLFDNGKCCQTYSIIHFYCGFSETDFTGFAGLVSYHYKNSHNLSESIYRNPVEYMLLDFYSELPAVAHGNEPLVFCTHIQPVDTFNPSDYEAYFDFRENQGIIKGDLKKYKEEMVFTYIFYDKKKRIMLLNAVGLTRYQELVEILGNKYTFPSEPGIFFSALMDGAVQQILGKKSPVFEYEHYFKDEPDANGYDAKESLEPLNALMREITDHNNNGTPYAIAALAQKYGIPLDTANRLEDMLKNMDKKYTLDINGGFSGFNPPPPVQRDKFRTAPRQNVLFTLDPRFEAEIPKLNLGIESLDDFLNLLDDLYFKIWKKRDYTVLMYTLFLLHKNGDAFQQLYDYAVECLKTFWQVLLPSKSAEDIELFFRKYQIFCSEVLQRTGLIAVDQSLPPDADHYIDYRIQATLFFRGLLRFIDF